MRVSPRELRAVRVGGLLTRYALLEESAFVVVEIPSTGSAGTSIEEPCAVEHWGIVLRGELVLRGRHTRVFGAGNAFYIPPGRTHRFSAAASAVVAGFAPLEEALENSPAGLRAARGMVPLRRAPLSAAPPTEVSIVGLRARSAVAGHVHTRSAVMGRWLFTRSIFGPVSGGADDWCDLPHWGQVIDGTLLLRWESGEIELLGAGDVFCCPRDAGGHRIEAVGGATMIDYTPVTAVRDPRLRRAARAAAAARHLDAHDTPPAEEDQPGVLPAGKRATALG